MLFSFVCLDAFILTLQLHFTSLLHCKVNQKDKKYVQQYLNISFIKDFLIQCFICILHVNGCGVMVTTTLPVAS